MLQDGARSAGWVRATARSLLLTFTTSVAACGGTLGETTTTTTLMIEETAATFAPEPPPPAPTAPPPTLPAQAPDQLSKQELRELVAPVALYPDVVLASLLPATTFPDQLHDASAYVGQAEQVDSVPQDRGWDGSVVGLLQFPDVLRWLDGNPAWTDEMGQAVTYQQADVLEAIQEYRRSVSSAGNLKSNQYQKVRTAPNQDILIEPARPDIVYVPSYDPVIATQPQPVVVQESPGINPWIAFGGGAVVGALGAWALYSIFDDDDDDHYYRRRIRGYDNYYYNRGRRPRAVVWNPRPRPYRRVQGWQRPQRLRYVSTAPAKRRAALRPPMNTTAVQAPSPAAVRKQQQRENRQGRQMQRQETRQSQQQQRREQQQIQQQQRQQKKQTQAAEKQQRQQQQQQQRQEQRGQRQQRQQQQQENRRQQEQQRQQQRQQQQQQRQQNQQQQRQQRQENQQQQQQRRQRRQENQQQKQQQRQENREQRQEKQQERKEQRQENKGGGGNNNNNNNKKQQQN